MSGKPANETQYEFRTEVKQLLNILAHSLYTHRDVFLRELISNASDALDKLRFESSKGTDYIDKDLALEIEISFDAKENILSIKDTGIGMSHDELIANIGTIAKSGSADFLKALGENKEEAANIIGKFGVGFYSVFMVAKKVVVKSKSFRPDAEAMEWTSDGTGSFTIKPLEGDVKRGTTIEIHLIDDAKEYTEAYHLKDVIKKHSNFISFPIKIEGEVVNTISALWREPKSSVTKEKYNEFYQYLTYDSDEPFEVIHTSIDAPIQFNCLLFIPGKDMDIFRFNREDYGLDMYVHRVLIEHKNKKLLPEYLSFVRGVVDSEDLPLNISRETLQDNMIFTKISQSVTSQVLNTLAKIAADEPDRFKTFWKEHGKVFKLGYSDYPNHDKFASILRFNSSHLKENDELTSFDDYVSRMKTDQKEIYYKTGVSRSALSLDPHLEIFRNKELEVLYLYDPIDEFALTGLRNYKDFEFKSVEQVDLKSLEKFEDKNNKTKDIPELTPEDQLHYASLLAKIKSILGDKVTDVKSSERLHDNAACLVNPDNSISSGMQKFMNMFDKEHTVPKKILEVNRDHKMIRNLIEIFKVNPDDKFITDSVEQMFESLLLLDGYLSDPYKLVGRINVMLEESSEWYKKIIEKKE
jgi:molecular chaperone HtpG